jgi:hypothetical protein
MSTVSPACTSTVSFQTMRPQRGDGAVDARAERRRGSHCLGRSARVWGALGVQGAVMIPATLGVMLWRAGTQL